MLGRHLPLSYVILLMLCCTWEQRTYGQTDQGQLDSLDAVISSTLHDTIRINAALKKAAFLELSDDSSAKALGKWALQTARSIDFSKGIYKAYYALASTHYESKRPDIMHLYIDSMMEMQDPAINKEMRADAYNLLGIAYYSNSDLIKSIIAWKQAMELYDPDHRAGVLSNIGNIYLSSDEVEKAAGYFQEAAKINEQVKHHQYLMVNYFNLAACYDAPDTLVIHYLRMSELNSRKAGYQRALPDIYTRMIRYLSDTRNFKEASTALDSIYSFVHHEGPDLISYYYDSSLAYYWYRLAKAKTAHQDSSFRGVLDGEVRPMDLFRRSADYYANELSTQAHLRSLMYDHQVLGDIYNELHEYEASVKSYKLSLAYKDSLAINKAKFILKDYERDQLAAEERERELKLENERQQQRFRLYMAWGGSILLVLIALGLWGRLRFIRKSKAELQKEKDISEGLLLNILPKVVANELKEKGHSDAQLIDHVTVLFTDFKGFTALSEQVTPRELVADLHECFSAFDSICEKYGIEKIKTIGDAYMAAGGLPSPNTTHAKDVTQAALEMAKVVEDGKAKKLAAGEPFFEIRIGIHTGPVVAGIVGVKKFQYDIWGDTVNTASRMESSGEVGKVNISESTYKLVKDDPDFSFVSRGKIEAKGKGVMEMYFISMT